MEARFYDDAGDFWAVARELYEADPVRHTTVLSVIHAVLNAPQPDAAPLVLVTLHDDEGFVTGAAMRTPPWPMGLSGVELEDVPLLVDALLPRHPELGSVVGPKDVSEAFAAAWAAASNSDVQTVVDLRLYRLDDLALPEVPGAARIATEADLDLVAEHWFAFATGELSHRGTTLADSENDFRRHLKLGTGVLLWEHDGAVVSSAAAKVPNAGASRIGPVYTPPEHRRHGYAAAATAAAAQWARHAGAKEVLLYTDLANPTSNGVYHRIGFRPVTDFVEFAFTPRA
ncbi:GNAT family N-acetyltransferase [Kutzneria sp. NPDC052558]|uniref:GNAT family N-acetyltransferase n=1 Tax=Kutzneria sp. NPDC052558 TaxID=3364121 RepID=UPI0037C9F6FE